MADDSKLKLEEKTKVKVKTSEEEIPKRKLTPRGTISNAPTEEGMASQGASSGLPAKTGEEAIPRRNLTPRGNAPLENTGQPSGQATQQESVPGARQVGQPQTQGQEQIPQRKLTPKGDIQQANQPQGQAQGQAQKTLEKPQPKPGHSISPSVPDEALKNKPGLKVPGSKQDLKNQAAKKATEPGKKVASNVAKKISKQAAQAAAKLALAAWNAIVAFFGWWVLVIVIIIVIVVLIFVLILGATAANGYFGKAQPVPGGTTSTNPDIKKAIDFSQTTNGVTGSTRLVFLNASDKNYMQNSGKIDSRLVKALDYLISKHKMVRISHIISDYDMMNTYEAGSDTNPQIIKNVTAHKDGLAADADEIDFVYKTVEPDSKCQSSGGIGSIGATLGVGVTIGGVGSGDSDIIYYNDLNQELLRLYCQASVADVAKDTNTTFNGKPAQALPIKILYQDPKPNIKHAGNAADPSLTTDATQKLIYDKVFQPEARRKVHQAITELLKWPYDSGNVNYNRITQLITYSNSRDIQPFQQDGTLDKLYGLPRPANYGLFYMLESWQNIHIAY